MKKVEVILKPHNKEWKDIFQIEAEKISDALGDNCIEIHHIGSTSIPGIYAKPIIDIMPIVRDLGEVDQYNLNMENIGYATKGECGFFMRRYFVKENAFHVHIFEQGNSEIDRHLKFKNWIINNLDDKNAYQKLKQQLATKYKYNLTAYAIAKTDFVSKIEEKSGWHGIRVCQAFTEDEWIEIKELHKKLNTGVQENNIQNNNENMHLLLFKQNQVIGYIHIKLQTDNPINIVYIDKQYENTKVYTYFRHFPINCVNS
ncbi:GrpB family protein [Francisella sp. SYW-2]|uniref:GrpB family protein n=1 Tax=Francisella sp. SYW-2 TaxID=2610886 RepID=UPI00123D25A5|nr:GrpB family protein [Francisella sp. SYW-2]